MTESIDQSVNRIKTNIIAKLVCYLRLLLRQIKQRDHTYISINDKARIISIFEIRQ
jgi:hypothetical protein